MRLGNKQLDSRKTLLIVLGVLVLAVAVVLEQGFKDAGYYATVIACVFFNAFFLANLLRFLNDVTGFFYLAGMLAANGLLLGFFAAPMLFVLILWLPAIAGVLVGFWARSSMSREKPESENFSDK